VSKPANDTDVASRSGSFPTPGHSEASLATFTICSYSGVSATAVTVLADPKPGYRVPADLRNAVALSGLDGPVRIAGPRSPRVAAQDFVNNGQLRPAAASSPSQADPVGELWESCSGANLCFRACTHRCHRTAKLQNRRSIHGHRLVRLRCFQRTYCRIRSIMPALRPPLFPGRLIGRPSPAPVAVFLHKDVVTHFV
jgi:hypothetical protein